MSDFLSSSHLPWFGTGGDSSDVVMASIVRLARNIDRIPFPNHASPDELAEVGRLAKNAVTRTMKELIAMEPENLPETEPAALAEKQLVSEAFLSDTAARCVYISEDENLSLMINEEDHIIIQSMAPGLSLSDASESAFAADDAIESKLDIAFDEKFGYLTARPENVGTGMHASVFLHLPGLVYTRNMGGIIAASNQLGLTVRGLYGNNSETIGNLFSVSNQATFGVSENSIIDNLGGAVHEIVTHERHAREAIMESASDRLSDAIWRAYGIMKYARSLGEPESLDIASKMRFGADMEILKDIRPEKFSDMIIAGRPNFIKNLEGDASLPPQDADKKRAALMREIIGGN